MQHALTLIYTDVLQLTVSAALFYKRHGFCKCKILIPMLPHLKRPDACCLQVSVLSELPFQYSQELRCPLRHNCHEFLPAQRALGGRGVGGLPGSSLRPETRSVYGARLIGRLAEVLPRYQYQGLTTLVDSTRARASLHTLYAGRDLR